MIDVEGEDALAPVEAGLSGPVRDGATAIAKGRWHGTIGLFADTPLKAAMLEAVDFAIDRAH